MECKECKMVDAIIELSKRIRRLEEAAKRAAETAPKMEGE